MMERRVKNRKRELEEEVKWRKIRMRKKDEGNWKERMNTKAETAMRVRLVEAVQAKLEKTPKVRKS